LDATISYLIAGIGVSVVGAATTFVAGFMNPLFWIGTAISIGSIIGCSVELAKVVAQRTDLRNKVDDKKASISTLKHEQEHIGNAQALTSELTANLNNVYSKLGNFFLNYWEGIDSQLQKCLDKETDIEGDLNSPLGILPGDYTFTENLWNVLADSLDLYVQKV